MRVSPASPLSAAAVFALSVLVGAAACRPEARDGVPPARTALAGYTAYNTSRSGDLQLQEAQQRAAAEKKKILLVFGGNWCVWCRALDAAFEAPNNAAMINGALVVLHLDIDTNTALDRKLDTPSRHGVPVVLVLDALGAVQQVQETGAWVQQLKAGAQSDLAPTSASPVAYDTEKVAAF